MSNKGMMVRGEAYYGKRDIDGKLPLGITNDPNKMKDINFFLENKPEPVVEKTKSKGKK